MPKQTNIALAVVQLAEVNNLIDSYGEQSFKLLYHEYLMRLKQWVRDTDEWQALDNTRFLAILKGVKGRPEVGLAAAKLERLFAAPIDLLGQPVSVRVHVGFVLQEALPKDIKKLLHQAGLALMQARRSAELFCIYSDKSKNPVIDEREIITALEAAVELGELHLYYQPKIHAGFGSLVGAEALLRWHRSDGRVLNPADFIQAAERHTVIRPITWWVLKAAIARLARWPENLNIAVNVTPSLFLGEEIIAVVEDALGLHDVAPKRLTLEVTEGVMIDNSLEVHRNLSRLRELGVRVSIDDFGTGFSSLSQFRNLPADELKIDKGFVMRMLESEKDLAIVKAVIALAHNFSLKVVAEGVESEAVARRLVELRCDVLQGFAFDAPLPLEDFEKRYQLKVRR